MKIKIKRPFRYQVSATKSKELQSGVYDVGVDISQERADLVLRFGKAEVVVEPVVEKKAPENKIVEAPENKSRVAKPTVRRRSTRTKPNK